MKLNSLKKLSLGFVAFLQATALVIYCGLIGLIIWKGDTLFGPLRPPLGPVVFLILFVISAIISTSIVLGYSFFIFWEEKKTAKAIRLIVYTTTWLVFYFLYILRLISLPLPIKP